MANRSAILRVLTLSMPLAVGACGGGAGGENLGGTGGARATAEGGAAGNGSQVAGRGGNGGLAGDV